ncbi:nucleotide exchange factor GrpE [Poseidonocella sp. HB161398]|uniref:nucleotide exchange factor GrpE n=1 Tax=Poseidonocella sp. HB161398 TaxID=2320855 RepID=UPI001109B67C|nr:nucleotide exchange factor GrpE [Poseidonocella sp. HB161398]
MADPKKEKGAFEDMPGAGAEDTIDIEALAREYERQAEAADGDTLTEDEAPAEVELGPNVDAVIAERDEYRDRMMRALAEAENARKRGERDRKDAEMYGGTKLARDMLPVYDNMKRAIESITEEQKAEHAALIEGVELTMRELVNIFGKHGISRIAPEVGEKFDPQVHQAMFEAPVPNTKAGDIIQVMAEGFMIRDRLLRPAQVGVSSTPA